MFEDRGELSGRNYPRGELSGYLLIMSQTTSALLLKTSLKLHVQQTTKVVDTLLENDTLQNIYNYVIHRPGGPYGKPSMTKVG